MKRFFLNLLCVSFLSSVAVGKATTEKASSDDSHENPVEASVHRGSIVFKNYCAKCHGETGDGNGRQAKLYKPRPANLVKSDKNDAYKELIIRRGGEAMGRSPFMPPWGNELTDEQVHDVVRFLRAINNNKN
jgi:mono/diheme cytochrome c family protein